MPDQVHRNGELCMVKHGIVFHHHVQIQLIATLLGKRGTDEPPAVGRHKIDHLWGDRLCCRDKVPFVFPVLIIHHDDYLALADILNGGFDGVELYVFFHQLVCVAFFFLKRGKRSFI